MKAVGYRQPGPIDAAQALEDIELPDPVAQGRDLLVEVDGIGTIEEVAGRITTALDARLA